MAGARGAYSTYNADKSGRSLVGNKRAEKRKMQCSRTPVERVKLTRHNDWMLE